MATKKTTQEEDLQEQDSPREKNNAKSVKPVFASRIMDRHNPAVIYEPGDEVPECYLSEIDSFKQRGIVK